MACINYITQNIFKNDLRQYTFNITNSGYIKEITNINTKNILNKKKYIAYKYNNSLLIE